MQKVSGVECALRGGLVEEAGTADLAAGSGASAAARQVAAAQAEVIKYANNRTQPIS